jgi:hypothetical protein
MTISPSYVGEPECNGVIERFMRTLKEQCLYLHQFQTLAEAIIARPRVVRRAPTVRAGSTTMSIAPFTCAKRSMPYKPSSSWRGGATIRPT